MKGILNIATCQHPVSPDISSNLAYIQKQALYAKSRGAEIAHFSECNLSGYGGFDYISYNELDKIKLQESLKALHKLSKSLNLWLIFGSHFFHKDGENPYNSLFVINNKGDLAGRYDKRFLTGPPDFDMDYYSPGKDPLIFSMNGVLCGLLICHEWRYPELYREYYGMGVKLIFQSWYDGNLSRTEYLEKGKELGEIISGTTRGMAANNHLWISGSNNSTPESSFASFMFRPDGSVMHKLRRNRAGVLMSRIDTTKKHIDPSVYHRDNIIKSPIGKTP